MLMRRLCPPHLQIALSVCAAMISGVRKVSSVVIQRQLSEIMGVELVVTQILSIGYQVYQ